MDNERSFGYMIWTLLLMSFSLTIALIMIDAPTWVISVVAASVFVSALCGNVVVAYIYRAIYNILLRPGLYIWATIVTIMGEQDWIAIAFYIALALQLVNIIKKFFAEIVLISCGR